MSSLKGAVNVSVPSSRDRFKVTSSTHSFEITTLHRSCSSDSYNSSKNYAGFVIYGIGNHSLKGNDVFIIGGKRCHPGYVCIVDSNEALRRFPRESGMVHGAAFRSVFGCSKESVEGLVGEGFAVMGGEVKFNSYSFNTTTKFHDSQNQMARETQRFIRYVVQEWKKGNSCQNYPLRNLMMPSQNSGW